MSIIKIKDKSYPILRADKNGFVLCIYCNQKHKHSNNNGDGHRVPDCINYENKLIFKGISFCNNDGYYVKFKKNTK